MKLFPGGQARGGREPAPASLIADDRWTA